MLSIKLKKDSREPLRVLCLGAHPDDIEIGCGGTILTLAAQYGKKLEVVWAVFSASSAREKEALKSADYFLKDVVRRKIIVHHFRDGYFPYDAAGIKDAFELLKKEKAPDVVFTHFRDDRHQDHRLISDLTWNTYRNHLILEYEIPKYDGDLAQPNFFVSIDTKTCRQKSAAVLKHFQTQREKHWLTGETLTSILRIRGIESGRSSRYAEGFYCRKICM